MSERCLLYYITDRTQFPGSEAERRRALLAKIAEAARSGVDYIQLREKDLSTRELEALAHEAVAIVRESNQLRTRDPQLRTENRELRTGSRIANGERRTTLLLINSRTDVALAVGADGVHLRSDDISPAEVRNIGSGCSGHWPLTTDHFRIAVSCHTPAEVARAARDGADFAVFAPVFEKKAEPHTPPAGLAALHEACQAGIPVLALGGVTLQNAAACIQAGATGIAAIRLFQENNLSIVVPALRRLSR